MDIIRQLLSQSLLTQKTKKRVLASTTFLCVYAFLLNGIQLGNYYALGDLPPHAKGIALRKFFNSWHPTMLGFSHQYPIHKFYFGVATELFGPIGQNILFLSLPLGAFLTFLFLGKRFVHEGTALYVAAGFYALNPLTLAEMVNGGTGEFLAYIGGPLIIEYLYRIVERDSWKPVLKAGAAFGFFGVIPWTLFWILVPFATKLLYTTRKQPRKIARLVGSGVLGILLSLPGVFYLIVRGGSIGTANGFYDQLTWNYADASVLSMLRLAGNHGSYALAFYGYNTEMWAAVGFVIPAIALLGWKNKRVRFLYLAVGGFIAFSVLTQMELTYSLFNVFPPLWTLRSMTKVLFPMSLCITLLFAVGFHFLISVLLHHGQAAAENFPKNYRDSGQTSVPELLFTAIIILSIISYTAPMAGAAGLSQTYGDGYAIPDEYNTVTDSVNGTVLWAPYSYTTQLRLRAAYPDHVGVKSGGLNTGKANGEYVSEFFQSIGDGERLYPYLSALNVQYVVVDERPQKRYPSTTGKIREETRHGAPWLFGDPSRFNARFTNSSAYEQVMTTQNLTVYRVVGIEGHADRENETGVHQLYTPQSTQTTAVGDNLVQNPQFENGLNGWWTNPDNDGTQAATVNTSNGTVLRLETTSGPVVPAAQEIQVTPGQDYAVDVTVFGNASVILYWYDGQKQPDNSNLIKRVEYNASEFPTAVTARSDVLSIRLRPKEELITVNQITVYPSKHTPVQEFERNTEGVPGVLIDGYSTSSTVGKSVAVNLPEESRERLHPDIVVTDAESSLIGETVYNDTYRQGMGILLTNEIESKIPDSATVVTHETEHGTVVDYWVEGDWDDTDVAVAYTSYHDDWTASQNSTHLRAYGWANAFTNSDTEDISWTGGGLRTPVIILWGVSWVAAILILMRIRSEPQE